MTGHDAEISTLTLGNAILQECFKYRQTQNSTSAYDLAQYITILDAYLDKHHKRSHDYYMYENNMWMPMIIKQKFAGLNMYAPIQNYIPRAGEDKPIVKDPQILALASYVVTTFFNISFDEKNAWVNTHCIFDQPSSGYNAYRLYSTNLSII